MSKLPLDLSPGRAFSKIDRTDWTRELWRAAYSMARRMIRDGGAYGLGRRYTWFLNHARKRFGASGWKIVQQAARIAFDLRAVSKAATGTREELAREGMLTRCVRLEPAPRGLGWCWAFTFDDLGSPNTARSLRAYRVSRRREVARVMAEDRLAPAGTRFAITPAGIAALRAAEAARATV